MRETAVRTRPASQWAYILFSVCLLAGPALAQNRPAPSAKNGGAANDGTGREPLQQRAINNNAADRTGAVLRQNGGSLLRATLASQADPGQAKLTDVSFFAVPVPEPKVIRKHDLVTVVVREESQFNSKGTTDFKKEANVEAKVDEFVRLQLRNFAILGGALGPNPPSIKLGGSRDFKGTGTVDRSDKIVARLTAEVLDVKPNGNLVLRAQGRTKMDDEIQEFVLSGTCRAADLTADNTVLSSQLFDLNLEKRTKGNIREGTRRGWGGKLLDAISPF